MSGLGELLLGKVDNESSEPNEDVKIKSNNNNNRNVRSNLIFERDNASLESRDTRDDRSQSDDHIQKIYPSRIEKDIHVEPDARSNASSTDDYVRELLDPNDRPRNVWHVVERPKKSLGDDKGQHHSEQTDYKRSKRDHSLDEKSQIEDNRRGSESDRRHDVESPSRAQQQRRVKIESATYDEHLKSSDAKSGSNTEIPPETQFQHSSRVKLETPSESAVKKSSHEEHDSLDRSRDDKSSPDRPRSSRYRDDERHGSKDRRGRHRGSDRDSRHRSSSSRSRHHRRRDYSDDERDHDRRRRDRDDGRRSRRRSDSRSRSRSPVLSSRRRDRSRSGTPQRNYRTVMVMQLSQGVNTRDLEDYFGDNIGNVREVRLIMDSRTRKHKGVAYIEFNDSRSAAKALAHNGRQLHGASLLIQAVSSSRSSSDLHSSTSKYNSSSSSRSNPNHPTSSSTATSSHPSSRSLPPGAYRMYVGALNPGVTEEMLRTIVEPFGPVLRCEVVRDRTTGISRGYAFVTYASAEDGQEAVRNLDGFELAGKNMRVSKSTDKSEH